MLRSFLSSCCFIFSTVSVAGTMGALIPESNFSGFYVGGSLGGNFSTASLTTANSSSVTFPGFFTGFASFSNNSATNLTTKIQDNAGMGALFIGYGLSRSNLYLGAEIFGNLSQYQMKSAISITQTYTLITPGPLPDVLFSPTVTNTNSWVTTAKVSPAQWGIDVRPGFLINSNLLMYGRVGVARAKLSLDSNFANNSPYQLVVSGLAVAPGVNQSSAAIALSNSKNVNALRLGGGLEYGFTPSWSIRMDYTNIQYGKIRMSGSTTQLIPLDPIVDPILLPVSFFGAGTLSASNSVQVRRVVSNTVMIGVSHYFS